MHFFRSRNYSQNENKTDAELISDYKQTGNNRSIEILFDRYAHLLYALCMKYLKNEEESRDAVINIFEKLLVSLKKYEVKNFTTWIHSVVRNYCLAKLQSDKPLAGRQPIEENLIATESDIYQEEQLKEIEFKKLEEALLSLNKEQRTCVELFYLEKHRYEEIAVITGYSLNQVKSYIQNGKRNLKTYLAGQNER